MKYEFTGETREIRGKTLHQIRALKDFGDVKAGELGDWIEEESNLSHEGDAWVYGNARVGGNARVFEDKHLLVVGPIGSRGGFTTFYRDIDGEITVKCGCFFGKLDAFLKKVALTHADNKYAQAYRKAAELARIWIDLTPEEGKNE